MFINIATIYICYWILATFKQKNSRAPIYTWARHRWRNAENVIYLSRFRNYSRVKCEACHLISFCFDLTQDYIDGFISQQPEHIADLEQNNNNNYIPRIVEENANSQYVVCHALVDFFCHFSFFYLMLWTFLYTVIKSLQSSSFQVFQDWSVFFFLRKFNGLLSK